MSEVTRLKLLLLDGTTPPEFIEEYVYINVTRMYEEVENVKFLNSMIKAGELAKFLEY